MAVYTSHGSVKRVALHYVCVCVLQTNKALAREIVQEWSRPIFYDPELEAEKRRQREDQLKVARAQVGPWGCREPRQLLCLVTGQHDLFYSPSAKCTCKC